MDIDLDLDRIERAAHEIDPVFTGSPQYVDEQLCRALGRTVTVKLETANPVRSFKGRGADSMLRTLRAGTRVVCASSGNFGQAIAYAGRARGMAVEVYVPDDINPGKRARMESFGARITPAGADSSAARKIAANHAGEPGTVLVEDGRQVEIAEGAGTIGVELLREGSYDTVVLPIGDGALITGVARWIKAKAPTTKVIGVNAAGAPSMRDSVRSGRAVSLDRIDTRAEGIAISEPMEESLRRVELLVDEIVTIDDDAMLDAAELALRTLGVLPELAGVAGLAALRWSDVPGERVATVVTGANPHPDHVRTICARLGT